MALTREEFEARGKDAVELAIAQRYREMSESDLIAAYVANWKRDQHAIDLGGRGLVDDIDFRVCNQFVSKRGLSEKAEEALREAFRG